MMNIFFSVFKKEKNKKPGSLGEVHDPTKRKCFISWTILSSWTWSSICAHSPSCYSSFTTSQVIFSKVNSWVFFQEKEEGLDLLVVLERGGLGLLVVLERGGLDLLLLLVLEGGEVLGGRGIEASFA